MSDEMPEWPADAPAEDEEQIDTETGLCDRVGAFLHRALNDRPSDIGPQVVTKWLVIAEVQGVNREDPTLRYVDSDLSPWDREGMVRQMLADDAERRIIYGVMNMIHGVDDEDGQDA